MFQQEIQNAKRRKELAEKNRQFNSRVNSILNNTHHQTLPTMSEVSVVKEVSNEFNDIKDQNLNEFRRFLNIATQIAQGLQEYAKTKHIAVVLKAEHHCMTHRGVREHESDMTTAIMLGAFKEDPATRDEFYKICMSMKGHE